MPAYQTKQSIAQGPGGGDKYVYTVVDSETQRSVDMFSHSRDSDALASKLNAAYHKGYVDGVHHGRGLVIPLLTCSAIIIVALLVLAIYLQSKLP